MLTYAYKNDFLLEMNSCQEKIIIKLFREKNFNLNSESNPASSLD